MGCDTYSVACGSLILAKGMSLEHAMLFVKAMFLEFWRDPSCFYTIVREPVEAQAPQEKSEQENKPPCLVATCEFWNKDGCPYYNTCAEAMIDRVNE